MRWKLLGAVSALALLPACGARPSAPSAPSGRATVQRVLVDSRAMGRPWPAVVVLPAAYQAEPGKRFPVLYLLHGAGSDHRTWVTCSSLAKELRTRPVICVCPNGRPFGWYVDSPYAGDSNIETFVTKELVSFVDGNYRTVAKREGRGICGFSMGGHGAVALAAKHPDVFSSASSICGIMDITRWPLQWGISRLLGPLEDNRELWKRESAMGLAPSFATAARGVRLFFDCGLDDFALPENRDLHGLLDRLGVPHVYKEHEGEHDTRYWTSHAAEHLDFHMESFDAAEETAADEHR